MNNHNTTQYNDKLKKIINLQIKNKFLPKQRSKEWFAIRKLSIGGSEISTIIGQNPYQKKEHLIYSKLNDKFESNIFTLWGTLFENITVHIIKDFMICGNSNIELSSLPGIIDRQRYSPDSIGIVKMIDGEYKIILFEFKSPSNRFPGDNIPYYYIPQIKTGLCSIKECDMGIFIDTLYKICMLKEFDDNNLFNKYKSVKSNGIKCNPIMMGIIYIHVNEELLHMLTNKSLLTIVNKLITNNKVIDFGNISEELMIELIHAINSGVINLYYEKHIFYVNDNIKMDNSIYVEKKFDKSYDINNHAKMLINLYSQQCANKKNKDKYVGFMCWKLFRCSIITMNRDDNYVNVIKKDLLDFLDMLDILYVNNTFNKELFMNIFPKFVYK